MAREAAPQLEKAVILQRLRGRGASVICRHSGSSAVCIQPSAFRTATFAHLSPRKPHLTGFPGEGGSGRMEHRRHRSTQKAQFSTLPMEDATGFSFEDPARLRQRSRRLRSSRPPGSTCCGGELHRRCSPHSAWRTRPGSAPNETTDHYVHATKDITLAFGPSVLLMFFVPFVFCCTFPTSP